MLSSMSVDVHPRADQPSLRYLAGCTHHVESGVHRCAQINSPCPVDTLRIANRDADPLDAITLDDLVVCSAAQFSASVSDTFCVNQTSSTLIDTTYAVCTSSAGFCVATNATGFCTGPDGGCLDMATSWQQCGARRAASSLDHLGWEGPEF